MKRCPECRRDYYDDTLLYCLDDGNVLLEGPASADEPATAILSVPPAVADGLTRPTEESESKTAILQPPATARGSDPAGEAEPQEKSGGISERQRLSANRAAKPLIAALIAVAVLIGGYLGYRYFKPAGGEQISSIAVLAFENRSGSADTDYLSDGLADSLIYRLSQLPNLKVSPTSSVMRYRGKETDVAQIAKELEVDVVMSGRLVQRGDDLSISVQLIDSRTKKLIWAEQYDRKMADLLATQREIATAITQKLQLQLSVDEKGITKKYTNSNEAYQLYLKGRYHFAKRTRDDFQRSIEYFEQAIRIDPNFALAYARIAEVYDQISGYPYMTPNEAFPKAKAAANRALEIDPTLAEGHTFLAQALALYDWNWTEAERSFKRGIELDPTNVSARFRYGQLYLAPTGRTDEAITEIRKALEAEPFDLNMGGNLATTYLFARQNQLALEQARKTYDLDPRFITGRYNLGLAMLANGMHDEAVQLSESWLADMPNEQFILAIAGCSYARAGRKSEAEAIIARFKRIAEKEYVISYSVAMIYTGLGDKDKAFAELERSYKQHDWPLHRLKVDPYWDYLRDDPRFAAMLKRLNLPG